VAWSDGRLLVQLMGSLPDVFAVLRIANRWAIKARYPREGWRFEWVEDNDQCVALDARECVYPNVLTAYGAPGLTAHFCAVDDLLHGGLPGISCERAQTLGRGDDRCNFRFCRADGSGALASPESDTLAAYACPAPVTSTWSTPEMACAAPRAPSPTRSWTGYLIFCAKTPSRR